MSKITKTQMEKLTKIETVDVHTVTFTVQGTEISFDVKTRIPVEEQANFVDFVMRSVFRDDIQIIDGEPTLIDEGSIYIPVNKPLAVRVATLMYYASMPNASELDNKRIVKLAENPLFMDEIIRHLQWDAYQDVLDAVEDSIDQQRRELIARETSAVRELINSVTTLKQELATVPYDQLTETVKSLAEIGNKWGDGGEPRK